MTRLLEGNLRLPVSIRFERDALGNSYTGRVDSGQFELSLPRISTNSNDDSITLHSPVPENERVSTHLDGSWGSGGYLSIDSEDRRPVSSFVAQMTFTVEEARSSDNELLEFATRFSTDLDLWFAVVREWLELWTDQPLNPDTREGARIRGNIWDTSVPGNGGSGFGLATMESHFGGWAVNRRMMTSACGRADRGEDVPEEWQMYLRAKRWNSQRLRVVDAATSAEMAVERRLFRELSERSSLSQSALDTILANAPGIVEKLKSLEAVLPPEKSRLNRVAHRIAGPRNSVVHAGVQPDETTAKHVLETAKELLDTYSPLAAP